MVLLFASVTTMSFGQSKESKVTIGGSASIGITQFFYTGNFSMIGYGAWIDFEKFGLSYSGGGALSNEDPTNYILGYADKYTAGLVYRNYGVHFHKIGKDENVFLGAGLQNITDISTDGMRNDYYPYMNAGWKQNVGQIGVIRVELLVSKVPTIGLGFGLRL